jgi:protein-arginine kinase activator protein McsA
MEIDIKAAYQSYLQIYESEKFEVLYDEDERPMMIREKKSMAAALTWFEWLIAEMEIGIENEAYEYCAVIRDELKLIENETDDKKLLEI